MEHYEFLLDKIANKIDNEEDRLYIKNNIKDIAIKLGQFSNLFNQVINISMKKCTQKDKIEEISSLKFINNKKLTKKNSKEILNALELKGGADPEEVEKLKNLKEVHDIIDKKSIFCFTNMWVLLSKLVTNFPKYGFLMVSKFFTDIAELYNFDWHSFNDFTSKLDWMFIFLFILASVPFVGFLFNVIIVIRAIKQERIFLALITFITTWVSMFTLHMFDLGVIIKFLYFIDVFSYVNPNNRIEAPLHGDASLLYNKDTENALVLKQDKSISNNNINISVDSDKLKGAISTVSNTAEILSDKNKLDSNSSQIKKILENKNSLNDLEYKIKRMENNEQNKEISSNNKKEESIQVDNKNTENASISNIEVKRSEIKELINKQKLSDFDRHSSSDKDGIKIDYGISLDEDSKKKDEQIYKIDDFLRK